MRIFAINPININSGYSLNRNNRSNYAVNFRGHDLLNLSEQEVFKRIRASITPENFIGQGTEAEVYRIKDTDYCIRIPYGAANIYKCNYSKELTPVDKINHIKAKLGYGTTIMEYFDGIVPKYYIGNEAQRYKLQSEIADMPIESYTDLLHQIADAVNNEMFYDSSGGNLIVDIKNKKLIPIDFCNIEENPRKIRPLCEMYHVLTCYGAEKDTGKKIFDKIVIGGLEEFKPGKIPCMDVELFDFVDLASKRNKDNGIRTQGYFSDRINTFNRTEAQLTESFRALKQIKKREITDKTLYLELTYKIREFKRLITKIH